MHDHAFSFSTMGTRAEITALGLDRDAVDRSAERIQGLERRWSRFLPDSEISLLNQASKQAEIDGVTPSPVVVSEETFLVLKMAVDAWDQTGGLFDPTIGAAMAAAGYDRSFDSIPNRSSRAERLARPAPGAGQIELDELVHSVLLVPGTVLDVGGIAKGVAADLAAQDLIDAGAEGCLVNIGGDLRAMGTAPRAEGWQVRIDCPGASRSIDVGMASGAICTTSKSKRRWHRSGPNGGVEHHLRDPKTGGRLETGVLSVTVIGAKASQAEVLCKAAFGAGLERGPELIADHGATGLMVGDSGVTVEVPGIERYRAAALPSTIEPDGRAAPCLGAASAGAA